MVLWQQHVKDDCMIKSHNIIFHYKTLGKSMQSLGNHMFYCIIIDAKARSSLIQYRGLLHENNMANTVNTLETPLHTSSMRNVKSIFLQQLMFGGLMRLLIGLGVSQGKYSTSAMLYSIISLSTCSLIMYFPYTCSSA